MIVQSVLPCVLALTTAFWEDPAVNSVDRLPARTYSVPLYRETDALTDALETGAETIRIEPRENQLGDIAERMPRLANFSHTAPGGWCIYWPKFKDRYLSDRLRWQYWTLRYE